MSDILGMFEEDSAVSAAEAVSTDGLKSVASARAPHPRHRSGNRQARKRSS
jgi:hypothetical protein